MKKLVFLCFAAMFLSLNAQNYCLEFDGVDDYISVTSSTDVISAFTVEAWVKPMHPTDNINILSTRSGTDEESFDMKLMSGNKIHGDIGNGTSWLTNTADGDFEYAIGTWYHIAYSVSATGYEIFADGTSVGSGTWPSDTPLLMDATHQINIGRYNGGLEYFKGCIDEVRVWNVARTGQEIRDNMLQPLLGTETGLVAYYGFGEAGGTTAGDSAGSNDGTLTNMAEEDWVLSFCFNPQIKSLSPADNFQYVTISENLEITFDRAILAGTGNVVIHKSSDDSIVETISASSCAIVDSIVTINPSSDFEYFTDYYVLIDNTSFMDNESVYFEGIAEKTIWNFTSEAVVYIKETSPLDNSVDISLSESLEITFNKNILAGTGNVVIHKSSDDSIVETIPASLCAIIGSKVTINPSNDFERITDYYVLIDITAFMDNDSAYFAGILEKTVWNFTSQNYFTDISAGLTGVYHGTSVWGDYDNDGDLDILLTGATDAGYISKIYRNDNGIFNDIAAGLTGLYYSSSAWGDYDNDGDLDILLTGHTGSGYISRIYRNDSCVFTDINAGLANVSQSSVAWGDYDNDGDLDILLTGSISNVGNSKIYRNDSGSFTDIGAVLSGVRLSSVDWGDYDNDGDLDILLIGDTGSGCVSKIYRNDNGIFNDIAAGLASILYGSAKWGDYDNDGDLDILLTGMTSLANTISKIYRNDAGIFTDIVAVIARVCYSSAEWGDYDNDGDLDILLTGYDSSWNRISKIYRNDSGVFTDISAGLAGVQYGTSTWGDYDNDGDLDILLTGESYAGKISKIYRNNSGTPNTPPVKPTKLVTIVENDSLKLSFNPTTDAQTPQAGLSYNLTLNINDRNNKPSMSDTETGYRRVVEIGNLCKVKKYAVPDFGNLPQEEKSFSWGVQAIDNCFAGSEFASSIEFVLSSPRDLILSSNVSMMESDVLKWEYINTDITDHYVIQIDDDSYFTSPFEKIYNFEKDKTDNSKDQILYFSMPINEFDEIDLFEDQKVYYWRMKPVYSDLSKVTLFSENSKNFKFVKTTYYPPSSISITAVTNTITVSWEAKKDESKGTAYKVYSSDNPYAEFPAGWTYEATVSGTEWVTTASEFKKFYCVTATSAVKDVIEQEVEETVKSK